MLARLQNLQRHQMKSVPDGGSLMLRASLCLPSSCNASDFELIAAQLVPVFDPSTQVAVSVNPLECFTLESAVPDISPWTIAAIAVFSLLIC
jgi:hypothetical protein